MSIELKNISKRFGEVVAVDDVSLTVAEGELVALLGPSGGGKTTVLRMIAGLEVPTEGDIVIRGQRMNDVPVQQRNIGFVFQGYALFKTMSVFDNIAFGLKIKKWKKADIADRVAELLKLFGLDGLGKRYPHQLSGGQRQRVAIARALVNRPSIILADEPTGNLDERTGVEIMDLLLGVVAERGAALILVTHSREFAERAGRRFVLSGGVLSPA